MKKLKTLLKTTGNTPSTTFYFTALRKSSCESADPLVAIYIPAGSARPERGNKKTNVGLGMILGKMHIEEKN
jgi:hypothetical protein